MRRTTHQTCMLVASKAQHAVHDWVYDRLPRCCQSLCRSPHARTNRAGSPRLQCCHQLLRTERTCPATSTVRPPKIRTYLLATSARLRQPITSKAGVASRTKSKQQFLLPGINLCSLPRIRLRQLISESQSSEQVVVTIRIKVDGQPVMELQANVSRPDLRGHTPCLGAEEKHGFVGVVPDQFLKGKHTMSAFALNPDPEAGGGPVLLGEDSLCNGISCSPDEVGHAWHRFEGERREWHAEQSLRALL